MEYTVGEMLDRLSIVNIKIWHHTDVVLNSSSSDIQVAKAARGAEAANSERRLLIKEINDFFGIKAEKFGGDAKI